LLHIDVPSLDRYFVIASYSSLRVVSSMILPLDRPLWVSSSLSAVYHLAGWFRPYTVIAGDSPFLAFVEI
jgi:hypothetical protein